MPSAAAAIATAPPREVPSKSNDASPSRSANFSTRSAVPPHRVVNPHADDPRTPPPADPAHTPSHKAPAPASYIARKTNIPAAHAAKSAPAPTPPADTASAPHRNPSSTLPRPRRRPQPRQPEFPESHSSPKIFPPQRQLFPPTRIPTELKHSLCRFTWGASAPRFFPPRTAVILSAATISRVKWLRSRRTRAPCSNPTPRGIPATSSVSSS